MIIDKSEVNISKPKLIAKRDDGMGVYQVGVSKKDNRQIVVLSKKNPSSIESEDLIPLDSLLNHTQPDSLEWQ